MATVTFAVLKGGGFINLPRNKSIVERSKVDLILANIYADDHVKEYEASMYF